MGLSLGLLITMATVTVGGALLEKVLGKLGKIEEAGFVGVATTTMLITTVVACVGKALVSVGSLGK